MILDRTDMFKVLAAETRVRIIELLKTKGPMCGKDIASTIEITPSAVSQHLRTLRQADLVTRQRQGYYVPYSLNETALDALRRQLAEVCSAADLTKLKQRDVKLSRLSLDLLRKYATELKTELQTVRNKVKEIEITET